MRIRLHLGRIVSSILAVQFALLASAAIAADLEMSLEVKSPQQKVGAKFTEQQPSSAQPHAEAVFTATAHEPLLVSWAATNKTAQTTFPDVLIHLLVAPVKAPAKNAAPGPKSGAPLAKDAVYESALTMDFAPGDRATGEFSLRLDMPGTYRVRIETRGLLGKYRHEYYAELKLVCK